MDSLGRAIDDTITRASIEQVIRCTSCDESEENINAWLSEHRKTAFAEKYEEQFPHLSCKVESISISKAN